MRLLSPIRTLVDTVALLPEVARAVLVLPTLSKQLAEVCRNTESLPQIVEQLERVQGDTQVLPEMRAEMAATRADTDQLAAAVVPLQAAAVRLGRFRGRRAQQPNGGG